MKSFTNKNLYFFIFSAYSVSWIIWSFCFIADEKIGNILRIAGTFAPSLAAIIIASISHKPEAVWLLKSSVNLKMRLSDYLYIFLTLPVIVTISYLIMRACKLETPSPSFRLAELPLVFIYILALMGPLGEEMGWRGFLLTRLFNKHCPLASGIIAGVIWSVWHLPLFFIKGALQYSLAQTFGYTAALAGYLYYTVILSVFITFIFLRTKKSILSALLIHTAANMSIGMMPIVFSKVGAIIQLSVMTIVIILVSVLNKKLLLRRTA